MFSKLLSLIMHTWGETFVADRVQCAKSLWLCAAIGAFCTLGEATSGPCDLTRARLLVV